MRLSNCNCGKMIDCGCVPYFDSYVDNTVSILSVGNLVSDTCVFDEYVIDWFKDGELSLVSGKGYDPDIEAFHPFLGDESIPVIGGQWKPVLRYVVIDGVKMYPTPKKCQNWCSDLNVELPSVEVPYITVTNIECGLKNLPASGIYDYQIRYNTTQDFAEATRTIRMYLSPDGSTAYLAFYFSAVYVADQVEFYYNEETTPLMRYIVGSNLTGSNINSDPEEIDNTYVASVVNIEDRVYSQGDYITIKVLPSVKEPGNFNTIWTLNLKCLPAGIFECNEFNSDMSRIDLNSITAIYNDVDCRYEFRWNMKDVLPSTHYQTNFYRYNTFVQSASAQLTTNAYQVDKMAYLNSKIEGRGYSAFSYGFTELAGYVSYSKIGSNATFQFDTASDYAYWKNSYQNLLNHTQFANYSTDPTDPNHYKTVSMTWRETMSVCGDNFVNRNLTFHLSSPVSFNDGSLTITIQMLNVANGIVQEPCDTTYDRVQQYLNNVSSSISQADFSGTTHCHATVPFNGSYVRQIPSFETSRVFIFTRNFYSPSLNSVCSLPLFTMTSTTFYGFYILYINIAITDQNDPVSNFKIQSRLNSSTGELEDAWTTIYEKSGGTVIIP